MWTLSSRAVHWIIVGAVVAAVLLVLCVVACIVRRRKRRRRRRPVLPAQLPPPMVYHKGMKYELQGGLGAEALNVLVRQSR
jgi:Flp pilus assembly protein TadB